MKKIVFCFLLGMGVSQVLTAQSAAQKTVTPSEFSSNLSQGKIIFTKTFVPGDGKEFKAMYSLALNEDPSINTGKKVIVTLSENSLRDFFSKNTGIASSWASVNKFVTDNKLSLETEKGWIAAIRYFNNLP